MNQAQAAHVSSVKQQYVRDILKHRNVVACGIGYKVTDGKQTDELSLVVSVTHKVHPSALAAEEMIPRELDGICTDVVELGVLCAHQLPTDRWRPAVPGCSVGHFRVSAGTFGCLVRRGEELFILSNNHVLSNCNECNPADAILQPGPADGGEMEDRIAELAEFIPLDFGVAEPECVMAGMVADVGNRLAELLGSEHRLQAMRRTPGVNQVDAALARPLTPDLVTNEILFIGPPTGVGVATLGTGVQKSGRTTAHTTGIITQIDATVQIEYYGPSALFENQLIATVMSEPGDSGSAVLNEDREVVGLLFAGSEHATIINPIQSVFSMLDVELVV